jgi:putative SOS response-associated peptidase YedK
LFNFSNPQGLLPLFNIAPMQPVAVVRVVAGGQERELVTLRWGLIPSWADDPKIGYRLINARVETAATKPSFRSAFKSRRCLVVADGYYEWQKLDAKKKQPFYIHMKGGKLFAFAGLWD